MTPPARSDVCFIILPGLAPDPLSVVPIKNYLETQGCAAIVSNFCGTPGPADFSSLTVDQCLANIGVLIRDAKKKYPVVVGVGISLGGALFMEYAKTHADLDYVVSIGTPFRIKNRFLIDSAITFAPLIHPLWKLVNPSQRRRPLPVEAAPMAMDFFGGRFLENLDAIRVPILFMHSKKDPVTDYRALFTYSLKCVNALTSIALSKNGGHEMNYDPLLVKNNVFSFLGLSG